MMGDSSDSDAVPRHTRNTIDQWHYSDYHMVEILTKNKLPVTWAICIITKHLVVIG